MPKAQRTPQTESTTAAPQPSTAVSLPPDIRADLLRAQAASITTAVALPTITIVGGGAGLWEFSHDHSTADKFNGVVLNNHPTNVLWDRPYGGQALAEDDPNRFPACSSTDGIVGVPREGFAHAGLNGGVGDGVATVECRTCPYNQWGTGAMFKQNGNPKGKAVTNQRKVYILLDGNQVPFELTLPPTSLGPFDEYLTSLLNRNVPVQAVVTEFRQEKKQKGQMKYAEARFSMVGTLTDEQFQAVMQKMQQYRTAINPPERATTGTEASEVIEDATFETFPAEEAGGEEELPF